MKTLAFSKSSVLFVGFAVLAVVAQFQMKKLYVPVFPPTTDLINTKYAFQDAAFIALGFRRLGADAAWVQLLQNMGDYGHIEKFGKNYPELKQDVLRVTRIDPYFHGAYLFGAATLAFLQPINRPAEALDVLREGIFYNPQYWQFRMYVAGIGYKMAGQSDRMITMLEDAVREPNCPTTVKSVLANTYKRDKRYAEALNIWEIILASPQGRDYHSRAQEEIPLLTDLIDQQQHATK